jgi:hypothetical protein
MKEHGPETAARGGDSDSCLEAVTVPLKFSGGLNDLSARTWERIGSSHNPPPTIVVIPMALGNQLSTCAPTLFFRHGFLLEFTKLTTFSGPICELCHTC